MSFDHWWFSCVLTDADEERFRSAFQQADMAAAGSMAAVERALGYWKQHPDKLNLRLDEQSTTIGQEEQGRIYNDFVWAFNLPGYAELGKDVATGDFLTEQSCYRFISMARCTPVSALWCALGSARSVLLPGRLGNLFLPKNQVADALAQTKSAYDGLVMSDAIARGMQLAGHSNTEDEVLSVLTHLPEGLERALASGTGFFAIACPQV